MDDDERKAKLARDARTGSIIAVVLGLPGVVAGGMLMVSALGIYPFMQLRVPTLVAFIAGLAFFLLGGLFVLAAFGPVKNERLGYGVYKLSLFLFLLLAHYAVFYGKSSSGISIGPFSVQWRTQFPLGAYLVLAIIDGFIAWWYLVGRQNGVNKAFSQRSDLVWVFLLTGLFFFLMLLGASLGLINPGARMRLGAPS